ncbi:hypothetical protein TCON_0606 [Astathelohania contejeani]|uniref:C2H2-type domain-containing protein n=1 Tax=Astathelohania contejeani TaxID=164912 RepID=A0ABQ7I1C8_9MICR|nr:hypothetical protein TCON_0606 [Thelohania contejeani]
MGKHVEMLTNDTILFMYFIRNARKEKYRMNIYNEDENLLLHRDIKMVDSKKLRFHDCNADPNEDLRYVNYSNRMNGFVCVQCDLKYVYKRCFLNHLRRKHSNQHENKSKWNK